jgi:hypothetical protein
MIVVGALGLICDGHLDLLDVGEPSDRRPVIFVFGLFQTCRFRELHARHGIRDDRGEAAVESVDVTAKLPES